MYFAGSHAMATPMDGNRYEYITVCVNEPKRWSVKTRTYKRVCTQYAELH